MADGIKGWARLIRATRVSYVGLGWALRNEEAFRIEVILVVLLAPLGLWLGHSGIERAVMMLSLILVLLVELLNTAVEVVVDRIGPEWHELSGRAKDLGSAAVHLSLLQVPLVWGLVLFG
ncbi:diacylglycerol kinase [Sinimarinibacterium sp. CAU 1509]|uniref:diacylglycerol kinase n=1 Tax=Sinimarinibacterium sp. CAU 1509 TaxID=2562283 RepID=UPI0010ABD17C|nr:diacylglycerol kinase [Sinimarinibacterium sp. CAU 1509]TJY61048.1 diacylglycerol kinase [Sinimarinibacterium sp. CAU 1509]